MLKKTEDIWNAFCCQLNAFIMQRVSDPSIADDILQEVFLKIHSRIDTLRDQTKIRAWIYQITHNTIIDYYRKPKFIAEAPETVFISDEIIEDDLNEEIASGLRELVNTLPDKYAQAIHLVEFQGFSQVKLAKKLGISISAAKSRVQRGRSMLRDSLMKCCHFQFDHYGTIIDYHPHACCCCSGESNHS